MSSLNIKKLGMIAVIGLAIFATLSSQAQTSGRYCFVLSDKAVPLKRLTVTLEPFQNLKEDQPASVEAEPKSGRVMTGHVHCGVKAVNVLKCTHDDDGGEFTLSTQSGSVSFETDFFEFTHDNKNSLRYEGNGVPMILQGALCSVEPKPSNSGVKELKEHSTNKPRSSAPQDANTLSPANAAH